MADNQEAEVVHCVNQTIREHTAAGVHDDWKMNDDYGYEPVSIKLFLNSVTAKLSAAGFKFSYRDGFGNACLPRTLADIKIAINDNTEEA